MKQRVKRIFSSLTENVDAVILMNGEEPNVDLSFLHVTGYESGLFEGCAAILWPDGKSDVISSALEESCAVGGDSRVIVYAKLAQRGQLLREALKGVKGLGINGSGLSVSNLEEIKRAAPGVEIVDVSVVIEKTRLVKDDSEVELVRNACKIASEVAHDIPDFLEVGMKEYEAAAELSYGMQKKGASSPSFDTISSFGRNSADPHHSPNDTVLKNCEFALFDFGAKYRRYCSDITRTFVASKVKKQQKDMYGIVLEAQAAGLANIRAGVNGRDVDAAARSIIDRSKSTGTMPHSLGHSLGLSVHDGGRMAPGVDLPLEKNMILTVEPGIYIPGYGGVRIEDVVRVKENGCEVLTSASKELTVI
ncbi:MAG: Xaa-Pro peptidase family protein [Methanomassiliicoccales archaeon]|jgi:Xaa-Pro dipeptidase